MSKQSLQDPFLNALRKEKVQVSIYLVNGIKLQGQVDAFDQSVVVLKNTVSQLVYKHAISTIVPARNVKMVQPLSSGNIIDPQIKRDSSNYMHDGVSTGSPIYG